MIFVLNEYNILHTLFDFISTLPLISHSIVGNGVDVNVTFTFRSSPFFNRHSFGRLFILGGSSLTENYRLY